MLQRIDLTRTYMYTIRIFAYLLPFYALILENEFYFLFFFFFENAHNGLYYLLEYRRVKVK